MYILVVEFALITGKIQMPVHSQSNAWRMRADRLRQPAALTTNVKCCLCVYVLTFL